MDTKLEWQDVFSEATDGTLDEYFQSLGEEFRDFYTVMKESGDVRFRMGPGQGSEFNAWFGKVQRDYTERYGDEMIASVRRLGLITFRIAMILTSLRVMDDGAFNSELICTEVDFKTAMIIAEVLIEHTAKVFRELPKAADSGGNQKTVRKQLFLDKLPEEFDRKTFVEIAGSLGIPLSTAERTVKRWCDDGVLVHLEQGKYQKK